MDIQMSAEDLAFREEVRAFAEANLSQTTREKIDLGKSLTKADHVEWQQCLYKRGWAAPEWPVEYGGTGWSLTKRYIFNDELGRAGAPPVVAFGMKMVAPVIQKFGTPEQKARFLPGILASDVWWCQGYSEPGAGSDLASLTTRAHRDGDHYVVNGIKAWTTLAQHAEWIFCLVRTDPNAKKQNGISFLLIDMKTPGITVHPVITMEGGHEVNETHFENVRVPVDNRVGDENQGWTCAKYLLTHERSSMANIGSLRRAVERTRNAASSVMSGGRPLTEDPFFATKLATIEIDVTALEYTLLRTLARVSAGGAPGPESSFLKIKATEISQALSEALLEAAGQHALADIRDDSAASGPAFAARSAARYFNNRKLTIFGGSNEIQKNIVAKAVLGL